MLPALAQGAIAVEQRIVLVKPIQGFIQAANVGTNPCAERAYLDADTIAAQKPAERIFRQRRNWT